MSDQNNVVMGNQHLTVRGNRRNDVSFSDVLQVGEDLQITVSKNAQISAGKKLVITADDVIEFRVGSTKLIMKKDGSVEISGNRITITGKGDVNIKSSSNVTVKGSKVLGN